MSNRLKVIVALAMITTNQAMAEKVYESTHELLTEAMQKGEAHGFLKGEMADQVSKRLKSNTALFADAKVEKSFSFSDCKRLSIIMTKKDLPTSDGKKHDFKFTVGLNYCPDGRTPYEIAGK